MYLWRPIPRHGSARTAGGVYGIVRVKLFVISLRYLLGRHGKVGVKVERESAGAIMLLSP